MQENKENIRLFLNAKNSPRKPKRKYFLTPDKILNRNNHNDSTVIEEQSYWHAQSDETFETIERMCNKTLSDPENSIHDYLANWDNRHSQEQKSDDEAITIRKMFEEFAINDQDQRKLINQTQLSEVEPPSCLWESTINNESCLQPSPVKIVGLLRPSTILEESGTDSFNSSNSFKTARPIPDTASSDQYETAYDTQTQSRNKYRSSDESVKSGSIHSNDSGRSTTSRPDASAYFELFPLRKIRHDEETHEPKVYNKSIFSKGKKTQNVDRDDSGDSCNTSRGISSLSMDSLEKPRRRRSKQKKYFDDSLELSRSLRKSSDVKKPVKKEPRKNGYKSENDNGDDSSVIVVSDDDEEEEENTTSSDDLNKGFVKGNEDPTDDSVISSEGSNLNVSREFNDTLEEIEYIMKQGQKYLTQKMSPPKHPQTPKAPRTPISALASLETPKVQRTPVSTASPSTPCTVIKRPKPYSVSKKAISPLHAKALKARTPQRFDDKFDHIVSPIRAYIHNTPKSPRTIKMKTTENIFESKFGKDSRPPSRIANEDEDDDTPSKALCSLPRKAYVSADYQHIVDERSPISIPGGDKIHRILEVGMAPAVLKHEGKFKTTLTPRRNKDFNHSKGSLADFSLASGDMSVLLLKDAKNLASKY